MYSIYASLFFTVAMLVTTTYFIMGGLPLLILDHDTPLDGRFIRRFFEIYCTLAFAAAAGATLSYSLAGWYGYALGAGCILGIVSVYRRTILPAMARLTSQIQGHDPKAIRRFRATHSLALLVNLAQLIVLVWGVVNLPL